MVRQLGSTAAVPQGRGELQPFCGVLRAAPNQESSCRMMWLLKGVEESKLRQGELDTYVGSREGFWKMKDNRRERSQRSKSERETADGLDSEASSVYLPYGRIYM